MAVARPRGSLEAIGRLAELSDHTTAFVLRAARELGVFDRLQTPRELAALAAETGTHAPSLLRALRALVLGGVLREPSPGTFVLAALGERLCSGRTPEWGAALQIAPAELAAWAGLDEAVRTGEPSFQRVHGASLREVAARDPVLRAHVAGLRRALAQHALVCALAAGDWSALRRVVDVGGDGTLLSALLARAPGLAAAWFELDGPADVGAALDPSVADRCEVIRAGGADLPRDAELYLLDHVLCWHGARAAALLGSVRDAMGTHSRLVVLEPLWSGDDDLALSVDLQLFVLAAGGFRTGSEMEVLFAEAGLKLARALPTGGVVWIEGHPA
jgi:hypothetical protein